jgi:DNA polymerase-3 subunit epsilon
MILHWFKKKYPDFWEIYAGSFNHQEHNDIDNERFVVFDTETTGLHFATDRILSLGAIGVIGNRIDVSKSLELYLHQEKYNNETAKIHGILKLGHLDKVSEQEAVKAFLSFAKNAVLVAHHIDFDVAIINSALHRMKLPPLKNKICDTGVLYKRTLDIAPDNKHYGLDELCNIYNISKHDRHTALGDAYIAALVFMKVLSALKKKYPQLALNDLFLPRRRQGLI